MPTLRPEVMKPDRLAYSVAEAARAMGVGKTAFYEYIKDGRVRTFKWGTRTLIRADDLLAALDAASGRIPYEKAGDPQAAG